MNMRRISQLVIGLILVISSACSGKPAQGTQASATDGVQQQNQAGGLTRIEQIQKRGTIRVGVILEAPWSIKDPTTGEWIGVTPDMFNWIAEKLGVKAEFVETDWGRVVPDVIADKIDVAAPGLNATPARAMVVSFTQPYIYTTYVYGMLASRTDIQTLEDLNKSTVTIMVHPGSTAVDVTAKWLPNAKMKETNEAGIEPLLAEVLAGRAEAWPVLNYLAPAYSAAYPELKFVPDWKAGIFGQPMGMAIALGQQDFLNFLNVCIDNMREQNVIDGSLAKWLTPDYLISSQK